MYFWLRLERNEASVYSQREIICRLAYLNDF